MFNSILVVCVGNICRSPTGERLLKKLLPNIKIDSAGVGALVGHEADRTAQEVAASNGISLERHIAKQLTSDLCQKYDLILVMEKKHIEAVSNIAPFARGKTMLYGHWLNKRDVPDPYKQSRESFEFVFALLDEASITWAKAINR
ncbi:protein tyrosine phosphatase [Serratia fonticola]|jgi:protein-tyrosine phosphatase|uniref:arsenate reductase/protein-tyrosine-phosphatase family protein n=1 Tax=Serratia fonticola TaxID=47917 RepID=UPI0016491E22|nr:protein tyrosine phosphatase [Serratia fonticola]MBC3252011.1 protein tyrosine phosphatase [Serratia fonticola]